MSIWRLVVAWRWGCRNDGWPWWVRCGEGCALVMLGPLSLTWLAGDCWTRRGENDDDSDDSDDGPGTA